MNIHQRFAELEKHTTNALTAARLVRDTELKNEAVSWSRVRYGWTEYFITSEGTKGYRVYITDASSSCDALRTFIHRFILADSPDWGDALLEVATEW